MPRPHRVDEWGIGPRVAELWALGRRGRSIATEVMPLIEDWARRARQQAPKPGAVAMAITRYMENDPVDRRTKQARAQSTVPAIAAEATAQIVRGQLDAFATIQAYADRLNAEVENLQGLKERDPESGALVVPDFSAYIGALARLSREMRGWTGLFVDIKDRLEQHQQFEQAYITILQAVRAECTPEQQMAIAARLRKDPAVMTALRDLGGGG